MKKSRSVNSAIGRTKSWVYFQIQCGKESGGGTLSPQGFRGKIPESGYGLQQAREHVKQVRKTTGEYAKYWQTVPLVIQRVTVTTTDIETDEGR